jgi:hypothetical protein
MIIALQLLVAIIGLFMYVSLVSPKWTVVGLVMFSAGLLSFLLRFTGFPFHVTG